MNYTAHTAGAIASAIGAIYLGNRIGLEPEPVLLALGAIAGGLLPDIDHPRSKIGKLTRPISDIIHLTVGHRTLTHSLLFILILSWLVSSLNIYLGLGLGIGMLSHILLDLLTLQSNGVAFLYPFNKKRIRLISYRLK